MRQWQSKSNKSKGGREVLKKRGHILFFSLALCLILTSATWAKSQPLKLDVESAINLALERNLDFRLIMLDWEQAQASLKRAQIVGDEDMLAEANKEWGKAEKHYLEQKQNYSSLVRSAYQELLESEASLANWEKAKERAEEQLKIDQSKFKAGLLSTLDIQRAENSLFNAKYSFESAIINLETKRMEFNQLLGLDLKQEVVLTERILLDFVPFTLELEECYSRALALDSTVLGAKENLEKAQEAVVVAKSPFTPQVELEKALATEEKAKIQVQQAEQALYFKIRGDYYGLLNRVQNLEAKERNVKLEAQTLLAEESKYAAGVLSNAQIVAQQEKLAQLEQEYSTELLQYNLARLKLLQTIGLDEHSRGEENGD
jgi:outer membrane protein TolC